MKPTELLNSRFKIQSMPAPLVAWHLESICTKPDRDCCDVLNVEDLKAVIKC